MCVWTKKRGSMKAEVLMATPCPKSLHGKGEKWIARNFFSPLFFSRSANSRFEIQGRE